MFSPLPEMTLDLAAARGSRDLTFMQSVWKPHQGQISCSFILLIEGAALIVARPTLSSHETITGGCISQ